MGSTEILFHFMTPTPTPSQVSGSALLARVTTQLEEVGRELDLSEEELERKEEQGEAVSER